VNHFSRSITKIFLFVESSPLKISVISLTEDWCFILNRNLKILNLNLIFYTFSCFSNFRDCINKGSKDISVALSIILINFLFKDYDSFKPLSQISKSDSCYKGYNFWNILTQDFFLCKAGNPSYMM